MKDQADAPADRVTPPKHGARKDLTQGPITRTLLLFSLPLLGGNALQSLNGTVNQIWVSHTLGEVAITALGNANIVMMLMLGVIFGVGMAANILVGQAVGGRDLALVKRVMGTATTFFLALSVGVAVLGGIVLAAHPRHDGNAAGGAGRRHHLPADHLRLRALSCTSSCSCRWRSAARGIPRRRSGSWPWRSPSTSR